MGGSYSAMENEKRTWDPHNLKFDRNIREICLKNLEEFKERENIYLCQEDSKWGNITFKHFYLTNKRVFLEFGAINCDVYTAVVNINTNHHGNYKIDETRKRTMDENIRDRMKKVIGMNNYSLCFRNSEHVAHYILEAMWKSSQLDGYDGPLMYYFKGNFTDNDKKKTNAFPAVLRPNFVNNTKKIYEFINNNFIATGVDYFLDGKDTYNILVVGLTGAGKSRLINVLFNQEVVSSAATFLSVSRDTYFVRGKGKIYDQETKEFKMRDIVVADTFGFCDTEWNDEEVVNLVKSRVSTNVQFIDAVIIAFKADRIGKESVKNIKEILKWLQYDKYYENFLFACTHSETVRREDREILRPHAKHKFGIIDTKREYIHKNSNRTSTLEPLMYLGFPPQETLNDLTTQRVTDSWDNLRCFLEGNFTLPGNKSQRIPLS